MTKFKDTDYLYATARLRCLENQMLGSRELQKMIDARTMEEAFKVLGEAGIGLNHSPEDYEQGLTESLKESYRLVEQLSPQKGIAELFRYRYDGHNLKAIIKSRLVEGGYDQICVDLGNLPPQELAGLLERGDMDGLHPLIGRAALEAQEALAKTSDPQLVDIIIDRGVLEAMGRRAAEYDSEFLNRLVTAQIDIANIRAAVRLQRMGKDAFFLRRVLAEGGRVETSRLIEAFGRGLDEILALLASSDYHTALEPAYDALRAGGGLTAFERLCDNCILGLLAKSKLIAFGIEPLISYLYGKESEIKAARIVLASKAAGVSAQQITERLRDAYA